ncbi:MAG TPA: DUF4350 domain-containing protein [Acidimicrobiia bacterium]|nr:DUF4350 domain-containing protein [Acidimicrobiia bacterium]
MIPRSTTLSDDGRRLRRGLVWAAGALTALLIAVIVFAALDRSTIVDGPSGSSFVTTATGTAALHDALDRLGRDPRRIGRPLTAEVLDGLGSYLLADSEFGNFDQVERAALRGFVERGGVAVILGVPPGAILATFDVDAAWRGRPVGEADVVDPSSPARAVLGARFGSFQTGHDGVALASGPDGDLAVAFPRGDGSVVLIADSSLAHNATVLLADNAIFLEHVLIGPTGFDDYRHGFDDRPADGLLGAAPGNWSGAVMLGAVVLVLALTSYGRRFGAIEPRERVSAPDRSLFLDSVARSLRRSKGPLPLDPLEAAVAHRLGLPADADGAALADRAERAGVPAALVGRLADPDGDRAAVLDQTLATLMTTRGHGT